MPIYMDRHDVSESVTAEHVAKLHQEDLKIQDQFGCRGLTYWFDDKRKTAFCLIEAPDKKALEDMHSNAHGQIPHSIIEVDAAVVETFLGRIEDPVKAKDSSLNIINDPAFRSIMVTEIQGLALDYKKMTYPNESLNKFYEAVPGILNSYAGIIVKRSKERFLVSFNSVSNCIHAAIDMHALFTHFTKENGYEKIHLRTGVSAGLPVTEKKSIFEDSIRLAEKMCAFVNGSIIVSSEVKDLYNSENIKAIVEDKGIIALTEADEQFLNALMDLTEQTWNDMSSKTNYFCKSLGCSKSQLYRKMIHLTGKSPNTFIKEYRLARALKMLEKNSGNISEIAFNTGFSSPSYFSKCFQKRYGHSPSDHVSA